MLRSWKDLTGSSLFQHPQLAAFNFILIFFQFFYTATRFHYLNSAIPLWYTKPWGDFQLTTKGNIFLIPIASLLITLAGAVFLLLMKKMYVLYLNEVVILSVTFFNIAMAYSLYRIIHIASVPFPSFINPSYLPLAIPFLVGFFLVYMITPSFIEYAKEKGIVTSPQIHSHPAMLLVKPSARAGGFIFTLAFIGCSLIFVPLSLPVVGIYIVSLLLAVLGLLDDYQNTHPASFLKIIEKPWLRLTLLTLIVSLVVFFNIKIGFVGNPFGGVLNLETLSFIPPILTIVWIVWVLNLLSWSNGIDGQYSGIIGIASLVIGLLALRFTPLLPQHIAYSQLAVITAGCSFGLVKYTWHPSKIMWGFSAMSAGLIVASLSILINSKVATSIMIILIPFMDALVTVIRRLLQKRNPLKGDRGHLHHLLLDRGWSVEKIAVFYWVTTAVFAFIGYMASEKYLRLVTLMVGGVVAFFIILMNLQSLTKKQVSPGSAKTLPRVEVPETASFSEY